jgi:hypothetical protein
LIEDALPILWRLAVNVMLTGLAWARRTKNNLVCVQRNRIDQNLGCASRKVLPNL